MKNCVWLQENVLLCYKNIVKSKKRSILILVILLGVILGSMQVLANNSNVLDADVVLLFRGSLIWILAMLAIYGIVSSKNGNIKKFEEELEDSIKAYSSLQQFDDDMRCSDKCVDKYNKNSIFIGEKYVMSITYGAWNKFKINIISLSGVTHVSIIDKRSSGIQNGFWITFYNLEDREVGSLFVANQSILLKITERIDQYIEESEETNYSTNILTSTMVKKELNKRNKKYGMSFVVLGTLILIGILIYSTVELIKIPTDYLYVKTIEAKATDIEQAGNTYYVRYKVTTENVNFRENVSAEYARKIQFGGVTISREQYYSESKQEYAFMKKKGLTANEVANTFRLDIIKVPLFFVILSAIMIGIGVYIRNSDKDLFKELHLTRD